MRFDERPEFLPARLTPDYRWEKIIRAVMRGYGVGVEGAVAKLEMEHREYDQTSRAELEETGRRMKELPIDDGRSSTGNSRPSAMECHEP
ncbi:MAG: hypothetical protein AABZ12_00280 [Planctomycetota bacterium]